MKTEDQYICIEDGTYIISCNRPTNDLFFQSSSLDLTFSTKILQSFVKSLDEIRGTPRYLIGNDPSTKGMTFKMSFLILSLTLEKKIVLFGRLG